MNVLCFRRHPIENKSQSVQCCVVISSLFSHETKQEIRFKCNMPVTCVSHIRGRSRILGHRGGDLDLPWHILNYLTHYWQLLPWTPPSRQKVLIFLQFFGNSEPRPQTNLDPPQVINWRQSSVHPSFFIILI